MRISIVLFGLFAFVLLCMAGAAVLIFSRRDGQGRIRPVGCVAGCLLALFLALLGVVGFIAFLASLGAHTGAHAVQSLPIQSATILTKAERASLPLEPFYDPDRPLHVLLVIDGHGVPLGQLVRIVEEISDGEARTRVEQLADAGGEPITVVDVALPASARDLREIEDELRVFLEDFRLEHGVRVRLGGTHRDL